MRITVCTSAWNGYSKYLPQWAHSVACQTRPVERVVIADLGGNDPADIEQATRILHNSQVTVVEADYQGMGNARNTAVAAARSEWVMHLDADDVLLPHAVNDCVRLSRRADVISLGAIRGDKTIVFPAVTRADILAGRHGAFSCAPFRKIFWERSPWHTRNDWIDSMFWLGLAQAGASFTGTERPGFIYRNHPTSFSHTLTPQDRAAARQQWLAAR